ncbi:MAG TPA: S9 family peptidase [Candidatus Limnocylindrales bacterium]|jgi:dipeptidyl aminopeptidase/acylaminoacyl peptidase
MNASGGHRHHDSRRVETAAYGSWRSAIDIELVASSAVSLGEPWLDGDDAYWLESRSAERGRRTLLRHTPDGATHELTPAPFPVGNRVHEYGGGSYTVDRGRVVASSSEDGRLWRIDPDGAADPVALTPPDAGRYADLRFDPVRDRLYAVRETHDAAEPARPDLVVNELVAIALDGSDGAGRALVSGPDFVAAPRPSPDGSVLAWLEWDLPGMPWDASRLRVAPVLADGSLGPARTVAGGDAISIVQPAWRADGVLHYVSDETAWWNLYALDGSGGLDGPARNLAPMQVELGDPAWVFARSSYAFLDDGGILAVGRADGRDRLLRITATGESSPVDDAVSAFTEIEGLQVGEASAILIGAGPHDGAIVARLDPGTGRVTGILARSLSTPLDPGLLPHAEPIAFPTTGGATARALYFPPTNDDFEAPDGELPPLLVLSHGGPTSAASSALSLDRAFFTSRGIAVVDVDYRGSTGYGRPYRDALNGEWGIVDVDDCIAAARFLADRGSVDPRRMAIKGGSAGGFTTLAALTTHPEVFAAGISHYGIADLEIIHLDGHKFESRYDEGLLAPWPEGRSVFRERSPIHAFDRIAAPMLITQGLDDRVVPPSQLDAMVTALHGRGIPHAAMTFEGEGHGYRKAESRRRVLAAELSFLGQVFGFAPADAIEPITVEHLAPTS